MWMSMMRLCWKKFIMEVISAYTVTPELLSLEDAALSSLVLWDPFIASIGTTLDIHSQTSILYREILLGEDSKDSSVASEVSESPISVNQSGIKKMRFSFSALVVQ